MTELKSSTITRILIILILVAILGIVSVSLINKDREMSSMKSEVIPGSTGIPLDMQAPATTETATFALG